MNDDLDNVVNCKYYSINEIQSLKIGNKNKFLSMFLISVFYLYKNFVDLENLLECTNKKFDIVAVTRITRITRKTRITRITSKLCKIKLKNCWIESTPTESSVEGTLLYIANHLSYKPCNDLNIYKKSVLESTFVEIINPKKSNIIVSMIYRHPSMDVTEFNQNYLNGLLDKISKGKKHISSWWFQYQFLLGDFLNYNEPRPTNDFLDSLVCSSLLPYILQPTRLTGHSKTLIGNIFCNLTSHEVIPGNITATRSDHLPQFLKAPNIFANFSSNKTNVF